MSHSEFHMIDVGTKSITRRRAIAQGTIHMQASTVEKVKQGQVPKGNVLAMAEVAGIMAAKNTPQWLPMCHPLGLDQVRLNWKFESTFIQVESEVICHGKTGVEMEALVSVQAALLCIYDMTKMLDTSMRITDIYLVQKEGGKSDFRSLNGDFCGAKSHSQKKSELLNKTAVVLTISDRASKGIYRDESGPILTQWGKDQGADILNEAILPDETDQIQHYIQTWVMEKKVDLILCTGGTGVGPRDHTPEVLDRLSARWVPGIGERLRQKGAMSTPHVWISRMGGAILESTLIILLPGSPRACRESLEVLESIVPHALEHLAMNPNKAPHLDKKRCEGGIHDHL